MEYRPVGNWPKVCRVGKTEVKAGDKLFFPTDKRRDEKSPAFAMSAKGRASLSFCTAYLTTDWKRGEVRRLANWLSDEE